MANITQSLRQLADWCDAHPDYAEKMEVEAHIWNWESSPEMVVADIRALSPCEKAPSDGNYFVTKRFDEIKLSVYHQSSGICKKVSKGMKTVTKEVPDPAAPMVTVTEEVEDFEWVCPDSVLGLVGAE